jgi:Ca2+-binding EF-hand superfamily protein
MATQNVNIGVNVSDNGSAAKTTQSVEKLHQVLKQAQKTAEAISVGGTAGSRMVASKAAPRGSEALTGEEYGRARGSAGTTGASARDFANQAQGLGGLVRLYATYAANVFAVGAAFTALKNAADTTNLVSGLDTLGAASGRNLGALSKQLVAATDGAISLREAMSATAMTSSAGMSNENIRRLAEVAKTASLALGVAMPDAINRLSRGIVKLEPELLDELGLFTKIGPATEKYALEMGKAVSQLTDFERRQAFANAVLEEGEQKFSALAEAAANPYDKLLASLKNVAQSGLELVNKVLVPIVDLLSQSPTALGAGLLGIASIVVRQALPAIGQLKEGLKSSADLALEAAKGKSGDALRAREQLNKLLEAKVEASADFEIQKLDALEAQLTAMREKGIRKRGALYKTLEKPLEDITNKEIAAAEKSVRILEGDAKKDPSKQPLATLERSTLEQLKNTIAAEEKLTALRVQNRDQIERQLQSTRQYAKLQEQVVEYETKAKKDAIVANAAYNSSLLGVRASWQLFRAEVEAADLKLKTIGPTILLIRGAMASLTNVVMTLGAAINKAFFIISIAATAFSVFEMIFSKGEKQVQQFDNALTNAKDSIDNVTRTLGALKDKAGIEQSTIQTALALSNAMQEVTDTAKAANKALVEVQSATGLWDKFWEGVKSFAGKDRASELSKTLAGQISSAIELLRREGLDQKFKQELETILNVKSLDLTKLSDVLENATNEQRQGVEKLLGASNTALGNRSLSLQKFKETTDKATLAYKQFIQSTTDNNPLFGLSESIIQSAMGLRELSSSADDSTKAFNELVANPDKLSTYSDEFRKSFAKIRGEFTLQKKAYDEYNSEVRRLEDNLKNLQTQSEQTTPDRSGAIVRETLKPQIEKAKKELDLKLMVTPDTSTFSSVSKLFSKEAETGIRRGIDFASRALKEAQVSAGAAIAKASAAALSGPRRIQAEAKIEREQLQSQLDLIDSNISLVDVQSQTVAELRLANALAQKKPTPEALDETIIANALAKVTRGQSVGESDFTGLTNQALRKQVTDAQTLAQVRNVQSKAAITRTQGQIQALDTTTEIGVTRARVAEQAELNSLVGANKKLEMDRLQIIQGISGITSKDLINSANLLEIQQNRVKQENELAKLTADIDLARRVGKSDAEVKALEKRKRLIEAAQKLENDNQGLKARDDLLKLELQRIQQSAALSKANQSLEDANAQNRLEKQQQLLSLTETTYGLPKTYALEMQAILANDQARLNTAQAIADVEAARQQKEEEFKAKKDTLLQSGAPTADTTAAIAAAQAQLDYENQLAKASKDRLTAELNGRIAINDQQKTVNLEQERFNSLLEQSNKFSETLTNVFGELGTSLGSFVQALTESTIQSEKNTKVLEILKDAREEAKKSADPKKLAAAEKAYGDQVKKNQKDEISGNIKVISSAKTLFNEKSGAYKALDAIEKVLHIARLARDAQAMASQAKEIAGTIATTVKKLPAYAADIYGKTIGQLGPIAGPAVATGLVAMLYSMMNQGSPASAATAFVPTGEQLQETQGTGMAWDSQGNKVETGGGVFGDPTQKLDSINKGIQTIKDNSIDGLRYDNRMLKALERMADSITGAARSIYASPGIRTGMDLGSLPGISTSNPWYSSIPLVGGLLGGIFGGSASSSTSVTDSGIRLQGTLEQLTNATNNMVIQYRNTRTDWSKSGGWFSSGSSGTNYGRDTMAANVEIQKSIANVFLDAKTMFTAIADMAELSNDSVTNAFRSISTNIDISLLGLTGEAVTKELNAVISGQLDKVSETLFSSFKQFRIFGEGLTDTVIRVVDSTQKIGVALKAMGSTFDATKDAFKEITASIMYQGKLITASTIPEDGPFAKISKFETAENIVKMAGGLENFTEQARFFIDNFLTETERMDIARERVSSALTELNLPINLSVEGFKQIVRSQNLSTESGRKMYQGLMDIQEVFLKTTERVTGLIKTSKDLEIQLLKAQGRTQEAEAALYSLATEGMTELERQWYDYNQSLQKQIDALTQVNKVTAERINLEQKILQISGNIVGLRVLELEKLDDSNRSIQLQIWAIEDYSNALSQSKNELQKATQAVKSAEESIISIQNRATDQYIEASKKVSDSQQAIANLAVEAAKKMRELGKSLKEFVSQQLNPETQKVNPLQKFSLTVSSALKGDNTSIESIPQVAQEALEASKANAKSAQEFNSTKAAILAGVLQVSKFAEQQSLLTNIPEEDPLVLANKALEEAILEQTKALNIANTINAKLVKEPENLVDEYTKANQTLLASLTDKLLAEEAIQRNQKQLDTLIFNTKDIVKAVTTVTTKTVLLSKYLEASLTTGFDSLDETLDKKLTYKQLVTALKGKATDAEILELIDAVDFNRDGIIESFELETLNSTSKIVSELASGFQTLDANLDGKISSSEFFEGMKGKASDEALSNIFKLIDADNNSIINGIEATAAESATLATNTNSGNLTLDKLLLSSDQVVKGITGPQGTNELTAAVSDTTSTVLNRVNEESFVEIISNTANTLLGINSLIDENKNLFLAIKAVADNTATIANASRPGTGVTVVQSPGGGILETVISAASSVVSGVINAAGNVVSSIGNAVSNAVSSVGNFISGIFSDERTKTNVSFSERLSNGISLYDFTYKEPYASVYGSDRKRGVIAQEIKDDYPSAVSISRNGMYMVDYTKLPIPSDKLKFATGGAFSNQVVTRPTSFQLGLMGEAGPEAIMPLARTRDGSLGVVSQPAPDSSFSVELLQQNQALVGEIRQLREEVNLLRHEARATASHTNKTTRILERVTQNGESLLVTDASTI